MNPTIKTIVFLLFVLLGLSNLSAQECLPEPEIRIGPYVLEGNSTILVPEMLKSRLPLSEANEENSRSVVQLEEELGGCTSVVFDNENKIIAIGIPESAGLEPDVLLRYFGENEVNLSEGCEGDPGCIAEAIWDILTSM